MNVNKYKIPLRDINVSGTSVNIPISLSFTPVDNSELIETKFINDEANKSINPIVDYKKVRFFPADNNWDLIRKLKININFFIDFYDNNAPFDYSYSEYANLNTNAGYGAGYYGDMGASFDDLYCRTKRVMNSFLRFNFFDSNISSENNFLFFNDIFTQIGVDQKNEFNFLLPEDQSPVNYYLGDSVLEPEMIHEGFYLYWFKDLVDNAPNQELEIYMTAVYNNAINGETVGLYTRQSSLQTPLEAIDINGPNGLNYLKVILKNDNGIYKYRFSGNTQQMVTGGGGVDVNPPLNNDIPTITFWQIAPNIGEN